MVASVNIYVQQDISASGISRPVLIDSLVFSGPSYAKWGDPWVANLDIYPAYGFYPSPRPWFYAHNPYSSYYPPYASYLFDQGGGSAWGQSPYENFDMTNSYPMMGWG